MDLETIMMSVLADINAERERQNQKWGIQRHSYTEWLAILVEEVGEAAQAMQKGNICHKTTDANDLYKEVIQISAVAAAIAEQIREEQENAKTTNRR